VDVDESYESAAARELVEELGVRASPTFLFKYLCRGAISPYWLGLHEAVITDELVVDPSEIAWHEWLTPDEFQEARQRWSFVADGLDAWQRYLSTANSAFFLARSPTRVGTGPDVGR
jgi:8-oxo-dGTP pyrophosphatase MutT (NUDIX family)